MWVCASAAARWWVTHHRPRSWGNVALFVTLAQARRRRSSGRSKAPTPCMVVHVWCIRPLCRSLSSCRCSRCSRSLLRSSLVSLALPPIPPLVVTSPTVTKQKRARRHLQPRPHPTHTSRHQARNTAAHTHPPHAPTHALRPNRPEVPTAVRPAGPIRLPVLIRTAPSARRPTVNLQWTRGLPVKHT